MPFEYNFFSWRILRRLHWEGSPDYLALPPQTLNSSFLKTFDRGLSIDRNAPIKGDGLGSIAVQSRRSPVESNEVKYPSDFAAYTNELSLRISSQLQLDGRDYLIEKMRRAHSDDQSEPVEGGFLVSQVTLDRIAKLDEKSESLD